MTQPTVRDFGVPAPDPERDFYPYYLGEHQNATCRRLHFLGTTLGALGLVQSVRKRSLRPA